MVYKKRLHGGMENCLFRTNYNTLHDSPLLQFLPVLRHVLTSHRGKLFA